MAENNDARGIYFGGGNTGFATVLPQAEQGSGLDIAIKAAEQKKAEKAQREKDILDRIKPGDVWGPMAPAANSMLQKAIDDYAAGNLSLADAMRVNVDYKTFMDQANTMQKDHTEALAAYKKDPVIRDDYASKWRYQKVVGDGSLEHAKNASIEGVDNLGFLNEWGGSQGVDEGKAVRSIATDLRETLNNFVLGEEEEFIGPGAKRFTRTTARALMNEAFEKGTDEDGNPTVKVKSAAKLRESGLLDSFLQSKPFHRVVMDRLYNRYNKERTNFSQAEIEDEAVKLIDLYGAEKQELTLDIDSQNARFSVPGTGRKPTKDEDSVEKRRIWYQNLQSGEPTRVLDALNYITGIDLPGTTLYDIADKNVPMRVVSGNRTGDKSWSNIRVDNFKAVDFTPLSANIRSDGKVAVRMEVDGKMVFKGWRDNIDSGNEIEFVLDPANMQSPEFWIQNLYNKSKVKGDADYSESAAGGISDGITTQSQTQPLSTTLGKGVLNDPDNLQ